MAALHKELADFGFVFFEKRNVYADDLGLFRNLNVPSSPIFGLTRFDPV
jgi:hypothetical protein